MMTKHVIKIGCCGFPVSRRKYFQTHRVVEVQQTFYRLPLERTVEKWRNEAPEDFEFTVKAWQVITHSPKSPTWRKAGIKLEKPEAYGSLKPTPENIDAWRKIVNIAKILHSKIIVVQTPPSFKMNDENLRNAIEFFKKARSVFGNIVIAWEPRGNWINNPESIREVVEETGIIHCVDPFIMDPVILGDIVYLRLHGKNGKWPNYRYKYSDNDLESLVSKITKYIREGCSEIYVMFNNVYMYDDSLAFKKKCINVFQGKCI